jgi:hypothetical protein
MIYSQVCLFFSFTAMGLICTLSTSPKLEWNTITKKQIAAKHQKKTMYSIYTYHVEVVSGKRYQGRDR